MCEFEDLLIREFEELMHPFTLYQLPRTIFQQFTGQTAGFIIFAGNDPF